MSPKKKLSALDARLLAAIEDSKPKDVAKQLAAGANPNTVDGRGYPALHSAASEGSLEIVRLLLDAGADIHAQDSDGAPEVRRGSRPRASAWTASGSRLATGPTSTTRTMPRG